MQTYNCYTDALMILTILFYSHEHNYDLLPIHISCSIFLLSLHLEVHILYLYQLPPVVFGDNTISFS